MKQVICLLLIGSVFLTGCAGREANPVQMYYPGDENRSCQALLTEMSQIQTDMTKLKTETDDKETSNVLLALCGILFFPAWFFIDMKDAEKIEYDAFSRRYSRLLILAAEKNCDMTGLPTEPKLILEEKVQKIKVEKKAE